MVPPTERLSTIVIDRLSSDSLSRLCEALEAQSILPPAPNNLSTAGKNTYLLDGLQQQHPKAHKLIHDTTNGPQIDIQVLTVNELKALARQLQAPFRSSDRKQAIVDSIIRNLTALQCKKAQVTQPAVHSTGSPALLASDRQSETIGRSHRSISQQHVIPASNIRSVNQHSAKYTTNANSDSRLATVLHDRQQTEGDASGFAWTQTPAAPMPHRNRQSVRAIMRHLFGRSQPRQAPADASFTQQQVIRMEQAYEAEEFSSQSLKAQRVAQEADVEGQRATLEQQWELQEQQRAMQARQWVCTVVAKFAEDVKHLHTKGKGQTVPEASVMHERLQAFPDRVQGYEALRDKPAEVIMQGSREFGCRNGFVVLLRGPEQFLTKGSGHIYICYIKEAPSEFKVGVCKDLPERRVDSGRLVGRVEHQRKRNNKEYLLEESFPVPHRKLVDEVLKLRLKCWNFHHPDKGDGYTEWFRNIKISVLKDHIHDVINVVTALYP
ncbi:hypothetical protein WJX79_000334 [Trebouxia sp. C0005]